MPRHRNCRRRPGGMIITGCHARSRPLNRPDRSACGIFGGNRLAGDLRSEPWQWIARTRCGRGSVRGKKTGSRLICFQIGNEPEFYRDANNRLRGPDWDLDKYLAQWVTFARAVIERVPDARFGGPDIGNSGQWLMRFTKEAPQLLPGRIVTCSGHYYAMGPPDNPSVTAERLLARHATWTATSRESSMPPGNRTWFIG